FQAEDGIRDKLVTGVQTCALPIWETAGGRRADLNWRARFCRSLNCATGAVAPAGGRGDCGAEIGDRRSETRRTGEGVGTTACSPTPASGDRPDRNPGTLSWLTVRSERGSGPRRWYGLGHDQSRAPPPCRRAARGLPRPGGTSA